MQDVSYIAAGAMLGFLPFALLFSALFLWRGGQPGRAKLVIGLAAALALGIAASVTLPDRKPLQPGTQILLDKYAPR